MNETHKYDSVVGIVLAAGKGTRMKSATPKVLHRVGDLPMVDWVLNSMRDSGVGQTCLVLSEELEGFEPLLERDPVPTVAIQSNRAGTGDAVASAGFAFDGLELPEYAVGRKLQGESLDGEFVLVCAGDVPAVTSDDLKEFIESCRKVDADLAVLGMDVPDPHGYGRLVTDGSSLLKIVEEKDADDETRKITICNTGIVFGRTRQVFAMLRALNNDNASGEYYLTDCFAHGVKQGLKIHCHVAKDWRNFRGVNDQNQLAAIESWISERQ